MATRQYYLFLFLFLIGCSPSDRVNDPESTLTIPESGSSAPAVIYRSNDVGKSWMPYDQGIPQAATVSALLSEDNTTYATTIHHGIYSMRYGEMRWTRLDSNLPEGIMVSSITTGDGIIIIGSYSHGIFVSRDGGRYWQPSLVSLKHTPVRSLLYDSHLVFAGTDNGVYRSTDQGNTWQQVFKGAQANGFTRLHDRIYVALSNGALMTTDEGISWKYIYQPRSLHDISNDGTNIYAMTLGDGLLTTGNDGVTWESINHGFGATKWYTFEVKNIDRQIFAAQWHGIYEFDLRNRTWIRLKNGLPDSTAFSTLEVAQYGLIAGIGLRKK
jgi:photosystem II stability/assembly factor-like uncharacterized protein